MPELDHRCAAQPYTSNWARRLGQNPCFSISWILVLAGVLRFGSVFVMRSFFHPQTWEFGEIAHLIVEGHGFSKWEPPVPSAFMPPGYPLLLAAMYYCFGEGTRTYVLLALAQAGLGVLLVRLVYELALAIYAEQSRARLAAIFAALYPPLVYMCNEYHSINVYIVLSVASVMFLVRALKDASSTQDVIYSALCMGLLLLFRAEAVALALCFALLLALRQAHFRMKRPAIFLVISLSCLAPWTLRNYLVLHHFIPTTTSAGLNLWIGNNPNATGSDRGGSRYIPPEVQARLDAVPRGDDFEIQWSQVLHSASVAYMRSHPGHELRLAERKLFALLVFDPGHEKGRRPVYWVPSLLLIVTAGAGLLTKPRPPLYVVGPILICIALSIATSLVFFALPRYKLVNDPFLCIFGASALCGLGIERQSIGRG